MVFRMRGGLYLLAAPLLAVAAPMVGVRAWAGVVALMLAWLTGPLLQRRLGSEAVLGSDLALSVVLWWVFGPISGAAFIPYAVVSVAPIVLPSSRRLLLAAVGAVAVEVALHVISAGRDLPLFHPHEPVPEAEFFTGAVIQVLLLVAVGLLMERIAGSLREGERAMAADLERERELHRLKDRFVATVSHELRTPLTALKGFTRALLEEDPGPEVRTEFLAIMADQAEELHALVEDLITFGRIEAGQLALSRTRVDVVPRARAVIDGLGPRAAGIELISPETLEVDVDPVRFNQILRNLIDNALKYGEAPHAVTLSLDCGTLVCIVEDRGDGVPPEFADRIFEPYERLVENTTMSQPGIGLGLPIVRRLADAHRGTVTFLHRSGGGSSFEVRIPDAAEVPALSLS
jgi:signal transduction histidine kinase